MHLEGLSQNSILDISPVVSARIGVFPGDTPFERKVLLDYQNGDHLRLSAISSTLHLGAHADAPTHYSEDAAAEDVSSLDLTVYLGPCEVVWATVPQGERVRLEHLPVGFIPQAPRILVRTGTFPNPDKWNSDFASLSPDLIDWLAGHGVRLVGIDTPSIDPEVCADLPAHSAVARHGMRILEGLNLSAVVEGIYTLIALPLRIEGAEASPVRAVLITSEPQIEERLD